MCLFLPQVQNLRHFFKQLQRERLQLSHSPPVSPRRTCALDLFARIFQLLTIQLIDSTFTGGGNVFNERGLKLKPGWLRAQFIHLEYRNPSLLNEWRALAQRWLRVSSPRCTITIFSLSTPLHQLQAALQSVRSQLFQVVIRFSLSSSCVRLASSLR